MHNFGTIYHQHMRLVFAEMAQQHRTWFAQFETLYRPRTVTAIRAGQLVSAEELAAARAGRSKLRRTLEAAMAQYGIDLWVCPAAPGTAPEEISTTGDPIMNLPWTYAGMPAMTIPVGYAANGLPLGLQLIGTYMADEKLVAWTKPLSQIF
jgi:Asp-tRNA(Asn)/Glu-tRNA(Gln) amidotransferase A subunit family amidase